MSLNLKDMKLATKLVGAFVALLVLTAVVGYIGYIGMKGVADRVTKMENVNQVVKLFMNARMQEENYLITSDDSYVDKVAEGVKQLDAKLKETSDYFQDQADKEQMAKVQDKVDSYSKTFVAYVNLEKEKDKAMEEMEAAGDVVLKQAEALMEDEKNKLHKDIGASNTSKEQLEARLSKVLYASQISELFQDSRINESRYIISRGEQQFMDTVDQNDVKTLSLIKGLRGMFTHQINIDQVDAIIKVR